MTFAACFNNHNGAFSNKSGFVREYIGGTSWRDLTANLADFNQGYTANGGYGYIKDMRFFKDHLWLIFHRGDGREYILRRKLLNGAAWQSVGDNNYVSAGNHDSLSLFVKRGPDWYIFGLDHTGLPTFWTFDSFSGSRVLYASDTGRYLSNGFDAIRKCVIDNPYFPDEVILGYFADDKWGRFNFVTKQFTGINNWTGSCVFALTVDRFKTIWSGDYNRYYYASTDGTAFSRIIGAGAVNPSTDTSYPEVWGFGAVGGSLYAVGCAPEAILKRTGARVDGVLTDLWTPVYVKTDDITFGSSLDGLGFMDCAPNFAALIIGCGAEPFYYARTNDPRTHTPPVGQVFSWNGHSLVDIGSGLDWLSGAHIVINDVADHSIANGPDRKAVDFW